MQLPALNLPMGQQGAWKPAYKVIAPLVVPKDQQGRLVHAYRGSLLGWLSDEQAAHFLRHNLVERIAEPDAPELPPSSVVGECVSAFAQLGVPLNAGRPTASKALRDNGRKFSNEAIAEAVRIRQAQAPIDEDRDFEVV
ncbi:hypothetical protein [Mycobacterium sp. Lab-001]|uniref:hypothetical protein n=1 Tax=Mycobacterium sp. Lab-001 TaxID=3410136 RepID=UPI003D16BD01